MNNDFSLNERKANTIHHNKEIKNNILFFNNKNFPFKFTNIKKEIKKRSNCIRKYFNIRNTVFEEMKSKKNSMVYNDLVKNMGKYFFGPNGKVTENYKFLKDYYEKREIKIGDNNKINAGILDYFSLLPKTDSYTQRLNSTKEQILLSSRNLSVAKSKFDFVEQKAMRLNRLFNKNKNFVTLNIKNVKNFYINDSSSTVEIGRNKKLIKKIKNNFNEHNKTNIHNIINKNFHLKMRKFKSYLIDNEKNQINESSYKDTSHKNTIIERYSNETIIKELKHKLNNMEPYNFFPLTSSHNKINMDETKRKGKIFPEINIKENLSQRIKPIVFLNRNSVIDLSFIRNNIRSKNDRNARGIIRKKKLEKMMFDKSDFSFSKLPNLQSITLSKKKEQLKFNKNFLFDSD